MAIDSQATRRLAKVKKLCTKYGIQLYWYGVPLKAKNISIKIKTKNLTRIEKCNKKRLALNLILIYVNSNV